MTTEEIEAREAAIANEAVVFAGQGKNHKIVHLISDGAKGAKQPRAVCGQWVSNRWRAPLDTEKVCSKCARGSWTSFSTFNQPRICADCGRRFADAAHRDSNSSLCPDCYDLAGILNEHADGGHRELPATDCPDCAEYIHAEGGHETEKRLDWCEACAVEVRVTNLRTMHERGEHEFAFLPSCPLCAEGEEQRALRIQHDLGGHDADRWAGCSDCAAQVAAADAQAHAVAERQQQEVERQTETVAFHLKTMADQLRLMAEEVERSGQLLLAASAEGMGPAALTMSVLPLANDLTALPATLDVVGLIRAAAHLGIVNEARQG